VFIIYAIAAVAFYLYANRHKNERAAYALMMIAAILFAAAAIMTLVQALFSLIVVVIALALIWRFFLRPALFGSRSSR
jgi:hypothetical protein